MDHPNLADPGFEPSDEQISELMHRAFEGLLEKHRESLRKLHEQVALESAEAMRLWMAKPCSQ